MKRKLNISVIAIIITLLIYFAIFIYLLVTSINSEPETIICPECGTEFEYERNEHNDSNV